MSYTNDTKFRIDWSLFWRHMHFFHYINVLSVAISWKCDFPINIPFLRIVCHFYVRELNLFAWLKTCFAKIFCFDYKLCRKIRPCVKSTRVRTVFKACFVFRCGLFIPFWRNLRVAWSQWRKKLMGKKLRIALNAINNRLEIDRKRSVWPNKNTFWK